MTSISSIWRTAVLTISIRAASLSSMRLRRNDPMTRFASATAEAQSLLDAYNANRPTSVPGSGPESLRVEYFTDAETYSGADLDKIVRLTHLGFLDECTATSLGKQGEAAKLMLL